MRHKKYFRAILIVMVISLILLTIAPALSNLE